MPTYLGEVVSPSRSPPAEILCYVTRGRFDSVALVKDFPTRKNKTPEHMAPARSVERNCSVGDEVDFGDAVVLNNQQL